MDEFKKITFKTAITVDLKENNLSGIDSIPLGNSAAVKELIGEGTVYEFVNKVMLGEKHPAKPDPWTTVILTEDWAKSFVQALKTPKPLFIDGHADFAISPKSRAIPDGYIVGGTVINDTLYLRNALPEGDTDNKKALVKQTVREIKAKMLSTSTSDHMRVVLSRDEEERIDTYFAVESLNGQSNALVEADQTGSEAEIILTSFKADDSFESKPKGETGMDKTNLELFTSLKNQIDTGKLALAEVATSLGVDLMTTKQKAALKRLNDAESLVGDITVFVDKINTEKEQNFVSLKEAKIKDKFKEDDLIEIATPLFALKSGSVAEIDAEIERIASFKVFETIQAKKLNEGNFTPGGSRDENTLEDSSDTMEG